MIKKTFIVLVLSFLAIPYELYAFPGDPTFFKGCKKKDTFLTQIDNYNHLTWLPLLEIVFAPALLLKGPSNTVIVYQIYRIDPATGEEIIIATVPGAGVLEYDDHDRDPGVNYQYALVAVLENGDHSQKIFTTVTESC